MDLELSDLQEQRRRKADQLRELGINPYASRAKRSHTTAAAIAHFTAFEQENEGADDETVITVAGRLVSRRDMGKTVFAHLRDGHGQLQLYLRVNDLGEEAFERFNRLADLGDFVQSTGRLFRTRTGEISLRATDV
ncbi:MAG: lysine--tRNA ligase, partial [Thermomicrobiales bacterium]|nr:lysine--tRNA ligase [Thermomicrobiales bacterium]